ncbi:MAG: ABC transporter permease [Chloroflexi bacterium]|nr:ABC transporter permease [Chloroflexota bacterium]
MRKLWLVAKQEYLKRVAKRSFLIGTLLIPIVFGIIIGVTIFIFERDKDENPFGFVDHSGVLAAGLIPESEDAMIEMRAFPDEASAQAALEAGEIQGYHVIPGDFLETLEVDLYYWDERPNRDVLIAFDDFVRANLLPNGPNTLQQRIIDGTVLNIRSVDGSREFSEETGFFNVIFPLVAAMFFIFVVMGASGYFLQAITDEKENRTMEIAITSLSPEQLIGGKSLGLLGVALTQVSVWVLSIAVAWMVANQTFDGLQDIRLPWDIMLVFVFFFVPTFALIGGMMTAIGGAVTELQEGQQIAGILNLLFTFPLFIMAIVMSDPNSPFLIFLSFWPTTSFLTITLRWGFTIIPIWQLALSWITLVAAAGVSVWAAARIFRIGMLRYGQRMTFEAVLAAIRPSSSSQR